MVTPRLKLWLPVSLGLSGLLFTVAALLLVHFLVGTQLGREHERDLTTAASQLADKLDARMYERWQDIRLAAGRQALRDRSGENAEREVVEEIKARHPRYAWVGFTDEGCVVRVSTESSLNGMNVEARPWCNEARKGAFVGDVHEAVLLKSRLKDIGKIGLLLDIAAPVRSLANEITGVLAAHVMADWLIDVNGSMGTAPPLETMIVTSHGLVVVGPEGLMGRTLDGGMLSSIRRDGLQEVRWPDGAFVSSAVTTKGVVDFPGFGWMAVARLPQGHVGAGERQLLVSLLTGGVAFSLLLALLGYVITRRLLPSAVEPIQAPSPLAVRRPRVPTSTG
jgi:hypothetical protein